MHSLLRHSAFRNPHSAFKTAIITTTTSLAIISLSLFTLFARAAAANTPGATPDAAFTLDADFPGGNIEVLGIEGNTVRVKQRQGDGTGTGFYWSFRIRGAGGRTLEFQFEKNIIGAHGPAVSADGGNTWRWLDDKSVKKPSKTFKYSFAPGEKELFFSSVVNYTEKELKRFLEKHKKVAELKVGTLCKSGKGRDVELLRIRGMEKKEKFKVLLTSRHHASETMASHVLEGIIEAALSGTPDGQWLRENVDFMIVPLVDKDGVEDGDQGNSRPPHDHNRDYAGEVQAVHPEVRAIREQVPPWLEGLPLFFLDMHCPLPDRHFFFFLGGSNARFNEILEAERKGPVPFAKGTLKERGAPPPSVPSTPAMNRARGTVTSQAWASRLPGVACATAAEIPHFNAEGVVMTAETSRLLGRDLARAIRVFLETRGDAAEKSAMPAPSAITSAARPSPDVSPINEAGPNGLNAAVASRTWQGIPGLERTAKGRMFFTWFTGGTKEPMPENMVLLCHSDDDGKTLSPLQVMAAPKDGSRCFDPVPWIDPKGRLWYLFNRGNKTSGEHGVHARICENPDAPEPVFGPEFRVGFDVPYSFRMNKPTVLSTGEWVMPVTFVNEPVFDWVVGKQKDKQQHLEGVAVSRDEGKTWKLHGAVSSPPWALEGMVTELKDGRLWLLIRTGAGHLWESFSTDKGVTWSEGRRSKIESPGSRFFIRRLSSGNLLLVNHHNFDRNHKGQGLRSHLTAQISTDDGRTWSRGLLLDWRQGVSYPDGVEDKDGMIWITYDYDRGGSRDADNSGHGYILMAKFREEDVAQRKNASGAIVLRHVINRLDPPSRPAKK